MLAVFNACNPPVRAGHENRALLMRRALAQRPADTVGWNILSSEGGDTASNHACGQIYKPDFHPHSSLPPSVTFETTLTSRGSFWLTCACVYSLDLRLSLHEDKFPLPGESPLQPGEVLLEGNQSGAALRVAGYLNSGTLDDYIITVHCDGVPLLLDYLRWEKWPERVTELELPHSVWSNLSLYS